MLFLGLPFRYKMAEHVIPKFMNKKWRQNNIHYYGGYAVHKFLRLYREKLFVRKRQLRKYVLIIHFQYYYKHWNRSQYIYRFLSYVFSHNQTQVQLLLRRFPNMDIEALKLKYPDVDLEKVKKYHRSQGHYVPQ